MGVLSDFDLRHLITDFGCRVLVETGSGGGQGVDAAAPLDFQQIFAIEPQHKLALAVALRHAANHKVTVIHAKIAAGLKEALAEIDPTAAAIFWMDAHQPGADGRPQLEAQLRLIAAHRDISHDVILIDDLRLYEDAAYDEGPCPEGQKPSDEYRHLHFLAPLLQDTHDIERSRRRTGYLCAYPHTAAPGPGAC